MSEIGQDKPSSKAAPRKRASQAKAVADQAMLPDTLGLETTEDESLSPEEILKQVVRKASTKRRASVPMVAKVPVLTAQDVNQIAGEQAERLISEALTGVQAQCLENAQALQALDEKLAFQRVMNQELQADVQALRQVNEDQAQLYSEQAEKLAKLEKQLVSAQAKIERLKARKTPVNEISDETMPATASLPQCVQAENLPMDIQEIADELPKEESLPHPVGVQATKMMTALASTFKKAMAKLPRIELSESEEEPITKPVISTLANTPDKFGHHFTSSTSLSFIVEEGLDHEKLIDQLPSLLQEHGLLTTCVQVTDKQEQVAVNFGTVLPNLPLLKSNMKKIQRYDLMFEKSEEGHKSVCLWMKSARDRDSHWHAKGELEFGAAPTFSLLLRCVKLVAAIGCQSVDIQALHHRGAELLLGGVTYSVSDVVAALAKKEGLTISHPIDDNPMLIEYIQQALDSAVLAP